MSDDDLQIKIKISRKLHPELHQCLSEATNKWERGEQLRLLATRYLQILAASDRIPRDSARDDTAATGRVSSPRRPRAQEAGESEQRKAAPGGQMIPGIDGALDSEDRGSLLSGLGSFLGIKAGA